MAGNDQLSGVPTICSHFSEWDLDNCVAAAPDISRAKVTEGYAKLLGLPLVVIDHRRGADGTSQTHGVIGEVEGRDVILFDDEIVSGGNFHTSDLEWAYDALGS